ncbi:hypothetical protein ANN_22714 [Periplaneta americana]|uniref:Uncharacterized protein n=1 Tax=Periplaneta americana TaxID=6978 RepID=A0ABQ8S8X2_PERAM|nr:hypothetical protein ANN_22714 [Periplaneta americana]
MQMHVRKAGASRMAGAGSKTDETSPDDERQFQEDLERARALSLESLALEQFRLQKQQQKQQKLEQLQFISNTCNVQEKRTGSEGVEKQAALKSRPRPGSFNTGGPRVPRILAPPPSAQRRNSATADLITFGSPEGSPTIRNHPCSALDELYESMGRSCSTTTLTSTVSSQSQFSLTGSQFVEDTHEHPPPRPSFLAHLINQSVPVPVGAAKASTTLVYSPVLSGRQALQSAEQVSDAKCNLDVLKTSVRGSVLEVFDPLLSNSRPEEKPSEVEIPALEESKDRLNLVSDANKASDNEVTKPGDNEIMKVYVGLNDFLEDLPQALQPVSGLGFLKNSSPSVSIFSHRPPVLHSKALNVVHNTVHPS